MATCLTEVSLLPTRMCPRTVRMLDNRVPYMYSPWYRSSSPGGGSPTGNKYVIVSERGRYTALQSQL
eukprot:6235454-Prymnesium_polylepis.1